MHLEEKLELLKKELYPDDLVIRFTEFKSIFKKIESKFLNSGGLNYPNSNWRERLKGFEETELRKDKFELLESKLDPKKKYWWVFLDQPDYEGSLHRIFDATLKGGRHLSYLFHQSPIFIIDKKYDWMIMVDESNRVLKEKRTHNTL